MAYRSWLKDVKHVCDLGQHLFQTRWNDPNYDKREDLRDARWRDAVSREPLVAQEFRRYFGTRMHDSWVISVTRSDDHIRIELDSIEGSAFCAELGLWLDVDLPLHLMPVELHCHGVCYARWARHTEHSGWLKHSPPRFRPIDPTRTISDAFVYDFFHQQEGRIQWIAMFRAWSNPSDFRKSDLYLMADCTSVSAVDRRAEALRDALGERFESLWQEYFNQTEFDVWDQPQLFALFDSVSNREGWIKNSLRQELLQVPGAFILEAYRANVEAEGVAK